MQPETKLMNEIMVALCERKCIVHRTNTGLFLTPDGCRRVMIGTAGQSDLQGHRPDGRAFYLEIKTETGIKKEAQEKFVTAMTKSGALAGFARSVKEAVEIVFEGEV